MKLLPRLYSPTNGNILIDDYDIDKVELYSLRRQIGIVPQEPLLFTGSVSDNIALTDPNASSEEIAKAAQTACAHEFIMGLPSGYSNELGERGANLSGGQRQRLAIARTLLANPKLLVMDEATSALDYDTERRVCQNLREALVGSSVFFVTHRLSTVRNAELIIMMHQGAIVETGTHEELISLQGRYYALLPTTEAENKSQIKDLIKYPSEIIKTSRLNRQSSRATDEGDVIQQSPVWMRATTLGLMGTATFALAWLAIAKTDEVTRLRVSRASWFCARNSDADRWNRCKNPSG